MMNPFLKTLSILCAAAQAGCCASPAAMSPELAARIVSDARLDSVCVRAGRLAAQGLTAGSGYAEVWIRDLNTFMTLACEVSDPALLREALLRFFAFQGPDGDIVDGYVPVENSGGGYAYRHSELAPGFAAHKNTVETDQESALVQALFKYVTATGDRSILEAEVGGRSVRERLGDALRYPVTERFDREHGLIWGATTADWGDVQPEHAWGVALDESSHRALDIYDQAMFLVAVDDYLMLVDDPGERARWTECADGIRENVRRWLWDEERGKYVPHIYLEGSPFPADFDERAIHYHGGTTVAVEAGLHDRDEVKRLYETMERNRLAAGANSIGLTLHPVYPAGTFANPGMAPYSYQNGGDWTWFGARMVQQLVRYGLYEEAYAALSPMLDRVLAHGGFYEWWTLDGQPRGSGEFRGSAGVLWDACRMLREAAAE